MRVKTFLIRYKQTQFVRDRITQLRLKKGVSEYQMSYDLGHSRSYVYNISSGKSLPPMAEFLQICNYFDITPSQFFDESEENPALLQTAIEELRKLNDDAHIGMQFGSLFRPQKKKCLNFLWKQGVQNPVFAAIGEGIIFLPAMNLDKHRLRRSYPAT